VPLADLPQPVEQLAVLGHGQERAAELAAFAGLVPGADFAAELVGHDLLAVADAEDRQPALEQRDRRARAALLGTPAGEPGKMIPLRLQPLERLLGQR
jgi:hypothetical protein